MSQPKADHANLVSRTWVVGEVLVDLILSADGDTKIDGVTYKPIVGGGPANTARAMAKWGLPTSFVGGFSTDRFGHLAWSEMTRDGVDLELSHESDLPTAKAILALDQEGKASYQFQVDSTATFDFHLEWLPREVPKLIHIGSLATIVKPGADSLFSWLLALKNSLNPPLVLFDPNVRTAFLGNSLKYREEFKKWLTLTDVLKASSDDLAFLYPNASIDAFAERVLGEGTSHLVITCAENGIKGFNSDEKVEVEASEVRVIDTVGAGDTVGAMIAGAIASEGIGALHGNQFRSVLTLASRAAALTCSRQGASSPTRNEYDDFWGS